MELIDFIQAAIFSLGVLLFAMAFGFIFSIFSVRQEEVEDIAEKRIELGFFSGACFIGTGFIAYLLL